LVRITESIFAKASFLGRVVSRKDKTVSPWWKLRCEALRFHPFSLVVPLPPLPRVEMNAKAAPLTTGVRDSKCCLFFT
jgi:hypothetical protein